MRNGYFLGSLLFVFLAAPIAFTSCSKKSDDLVHPTSTTTPTTPVKLEPTVVNTNLYTHADSSSEARANFYYGPVFPPMYKNSTRGWQGLPSLGMENGHMYMASFSGVRDEEPGNYITIAQSDDNGVTWTENKMIIAPMSTANREIEPSFWNEKGGELHITWTFTNGFWDGGAGGCWDMKIKSVNGQIQTTKATYMFPGVMNVKPVYIGSDSTRIIFPVAGWNTGTKFGTSFKTYDITQTPADINGPYLYTGYYNTGSKQFSTPQKFSLIYQNYSIRNFDEHQVVALDENNFIAMLRTTQGTFKSTSSDGGRTWVYPTKFTDVGATAASRLAFTKLKSGNLLLVLNNDVTRTNMTAFLSKDGGKTWPHKMVLDRRAAAIGGTSYPDATQNNKGEILIAYDAARLYSGELNFNRLTEDMIIRNDTAAVFRKKVSRLN